MRIRIPLFLACLMTAVLACAQTSTRVRLISDAEEIPAGGGFLVAAELSMARGWHTYWRTPGDSGQPTKVVWTLPTGFSASPLEWPVPEKLVEEGLVVNAYNGVVRIFIPLTVSSGVAPGRYDLTAKVSWLECEKSCIKGSAVVPLSIVVGPRRVDSVDAELIRKGRDGLPKPAVFPVEVRWADAGSSDIRIAEFSFPGGEGTWDPILDRSPEGQWSGKTSARRDRDRTILQSAFNRFEQAWPQQAGGLLVRTSADGTREAFEFSAQFGAPAVSREGSPASKAISGNTSPPEPVAPSPRGASFAGMLLAAFLGGLVLNIMPCVLPVIALKILGFVGQASQNPGRVRVMGLVYGAGVLASFLALALLVVAVKSAGGTASWGMQFQNPKFLLVTTLLVVLVALNLFGVFEVILPGSAMQSASDLSGKEGLGGAFFNGVLATLLATPCTAPFLGVSLGFALSQSSATVVLFFLTAGAGLAFPYVLLCWQPAWLKFLPRPGNWMVTFKVAMGFPVMATGLWLFTLTTPHYGADRAFWVAMALVTLAMAAWVYGAVVQHSRRTPFVGWISIAVLVAAAYGWFLEKELDWRHPPARSRSTAKQEGPIGWMPWSQGSVEEFRRQGRPVLVDFTADWCTTCQINKRRAIEVEPVVRRLKELKFATLIGDFTFEDAAIALELKRFRRAGVPLVLVYPADISKEPVVMPDGLMSEADMLAALDRVAGTTR
jgi:thiol:disulfide interchange protein